MLTPISYNKISVIDPNTGIERFANIFNDRVFHYEDVFVAELFQIGFGKMCSITDAIVIDILNVINNTIIPLPKSMKNLPRWIKLKYFPKFIFDDYNGFDHVLEDLGDCNKKCKPIPHFKTFAETTQGLRQLKEFGLTTIPIWPVISLAQSAMNKVMDELYENGYCTPYMP